MNKQNPFSLYDFLGYLIPGAILIYAFLIFRFIDSTPEFNIDLLIKNLSQLNLENIFPFIIAAYALGHMLSFISAITIESYANWMYTYPSKYLLENQTQRKQRQNSKSYWKKPVLLNWKLNFWRAILLIILLPCVILDIILGHIFGLKTLYQKSLDSFLRNAILQKIYLLIDKLGINNNKKRIKFKIEEHDFHRIVTHYTFENSKHHQFRMVNYVALYGFLRNLSLIFNLVSWYIIMRLSIEADFTKDVNFIKAFVLTVSMLTSYIGFMAFMKFYRRYTLEGLMLLLVDENINKDVSVMKLEEQFID